jgi:23S rRNA (pseudouridine1915-N3)-methyltransferase
LIFINFCGKNFIMKVEIWWVGKTFQDFTQKGYTEFLKRIQKFNSAEIVEIAEIKGQTNPKVLKNLEADKILAKLKPDDFLILLDENGKTLKSPEFADFIQKKENQSIKKLIFLIGGAYGFDEKIYERANDKISLSKMTFSHQLIRLIFMEQLYRAYTIMNNLPYHNE